MDCHQSYSFSKITVRIFSSLVHHFYSSLFRSISTIHGGSHHHSQHVKTEAEFLLNLAPFSSRFMVLAWCHPLIIVFDCENSFHPSGAIQESFQFDSSEPIISEVFILSFQLSFSKSYRCIIQIFQLFRCIIYLFNNLFQRCFLLSGP